MVHEWNVFANQEAVARSSLILCSGVSMIATCFARGGDI